MSLQQLSKSPLPFPLQQHQRLKSSFITPPASHFPWEGSQWLPTAPRGSFQLSRIQITNIGGHSLFINGTKSVMYNIMEVRDYQNPFCFAISCFIFETSMDSQSCFLAILKLFKNDGFNIILFIPCYFVFLNPSPSNLLITISSKNMSYIQRYLEEKVFISVSSISIQISYL